MMENITYHCPECESDCIISYSEQAFFLNSLEYYCESVKINDSNAKASCKDCGWRGVFDKLIPSDSEYFKMAR